MNILVIGSGGREHAIIRCLKKSESCDNLYCIPGNPGIENFAKCLTLDISIPENIIEFCKLNKIELVVIGPEQPLADGLSDSLRSADLLVFAPSKAAAQLETSKSFAKKFMQKYNIPTAKFQTFSKNQQKEAVKYVKAHTLPIVLKADGLAGGKGVIITSDVGEAIITLNNYLNGAFGLASEKIVIEEFMHGVEASVFAICDGENFITLAPAQDHKRIGENNTGKNTGGMGAYAPADIVSNDMLEKIKKQIIIPTLIGMKKEGMSFVGCLYIGLMLEDKNPKVVEYNVRFGDPEAQVVLSIFDGNFAKLLYSAASGKLDTKIVNTIAKGTACCVILASSGYPDKVEVGKEITGNISETKNTFVFHSGTKNQNNKLVTSGGRVLGVTGFGATLNIAIKNSYDKVNEINFEGKYFRKDIGKYRE